MAFLSGLKAAYDSIGSEITKTFDSSRESQPESRERDASPEVEGPPSTPASTDKVSSSLPGGIQVTTVVLFKKQTSMYMTPKGGEEQSENADSAFSDNNWGGEWEQQASRGRARPTSRQAKPQAGTPSMDMSSPESVKVPQSVSSPLVTTGTSTAEGKGGSSRGVKGGGGGGEGGPLATSTPAKTPQTKSQVCVIMW